MSQKTIVITGASSGIGEALALHYAKQGENLVLTGRDRERLDGVAAACERYGAHVSYGVVDVKDKEGLAKFLLEQDAKTPIDVIVANAGISGGTAGLESTQILKQVREIYDVNVMGVINTLEPLVEKMIIRAYGMHGIFDARVADKDINLCKFKNAFKNRYITSTLTKNYMIRTNNGIIYT